MNKYLLLFLCVAIPFFAKAQQQYLEGAVPEVKGKVLYNKIISVKDKISDDVLFSLMDKWAKDNYNTEGNLTNRVLLSNPTTKSIACSGEKYLVFQSTALSLDRAKMIYQLIIQIGNNQCDVTIRNIKYDYADYKEITPAEEVIIDKYALNKDKDKLNRFYDKFRKHTVDSVSSIFRSIDVYLNGISTSGVTSTSAQSVAPATQTPVAAAPVQQQASVTQPVVAETPAPVQTVSTPVQTTQTTVIEPAPTVMNSPIISSAPASTSTSAAVPAPVTDKNNNAEASMQGYRQVAPDRIPGNIVKLLSDAMLITSGTSTQTNVMAASWGGLGRFWEKPVAFCFLNPTRYSVQTMDKGDTYTLSFYTEAYRDAVQYCGSVSGRNTDKIKGSGLTPIKTPSGATAFAEAWLIIECKKVVAQQISPDAVVAKDLSPDWSKNGFHKMYIGEILSVWVK